MNGDLHGRKSSSLFSVHYVFHLGPRRLKNVVSSKVIRNEVLYIVFLHDLMGFGP